MNFLILFSLVCNLLVMGSVIERGAWEPINWGNLLICVAYTFWVYKKMSE